MQTDFISVHISTATRPCSRPNPDCLKPPKGMLGSTMLWQLTQTVRFDGEKFADVGGRIRLRSNCADRCVHEVASMGKGNECNDTPLLRQPVCEPFSRETP